MLERLSELDGLQEILDEIPEQEGRAIFTLGIIPLLDRTRNIERFLERNPNFAQEFGRFARTVVYITDLHLSHGKRE